MKPRLVTLGLLALAGCSKPTIEPPRSEVTGTVTVRGRPLPGGIISFLSDTGFQDSAPIDENGHYQILAAVGPNKIRIDNRILRRDKDGAARSPGVGHAGASLQAQKGQKNPTGHSPRLKSSPEITEHVVTGTYVPIREGYASFDSSGLAYSVTDKPQTKDLDVQ